MKKRDYKKEMVEAVEDELEELLADTGDQDELEETSICEVEISKVKMPENVLRDNPDEDIDFLANSIQKEGLLQPILISKDGTLIAGYRRLMACKRLKRNTIKAHVVEGGLDNQHLVAGVENIQRKQMTNEEEAKLYSRMLKDKARFPTQKSLAKAMNVREARISDLLKVIGEGKEYAAVKERKRIQGTTEEVIPKEKRGRILEGNLPSGVTATILERSINISFRIKIEGEKRRQNFDIKQELVSVIEEISSEDFLQEMSIIHRNMR